MITDRFNCFQRNPDILQDVCNRQVEISNLVISASTDDETINYYKLKISQYKYFDI